MREITTYKIAISEAERFLLRAKVFVMEIESRPSDAKDDQSLASIEKSVSSLTNALANIRKV